MESNYEKNLIRIIINYEINLSDKDCGGSQIVAKANNLQIIEMCALAKIALPRLFILTLSTSPAGSLLAVKLHPENRVILNRKYEILISLILQWQDNPRKTIRNQLSLIIG